MADAILRLMKNGNGYDVVCAIKRNFEASNPMSHNVIKKVVFSVNNARKIEMALGRNITADPIIGTYFESLDAGDLVSASWTDSRGREFLTSVTV